MIYTATLSVYANKALGSSLVTQSSTKNMRDLLDKSPKETGMDVILLGPRDVHGVQGNNLIKAMVNKHPKIGVIYLYENDEDADLIDADLSKKVKKINAKEITDVYKDYTATHRVSEDNSVIISKDMIDPESDEIGEGQTHVSEADLGAYHEQINLPTFQLDDSDSDIDFSSIDMGTEATPDDTTKKVGLGGDDVFEINLPDIDNSEYTEPTTMQMDTNNNTRFYTPENSAGMTNVPPAASIEESIQRNNSFQDWNIFKEQLNKDSIVKHLIEENSEYVGLINILEVLDKQIQTVWRDPAKSPEQKFEEIKAIGLQRSVYRATTNSMNVEKAISIISTIVLSAKKTVEEKIESIDSSIYKISTDKESLLDTSYIDQSIQERTAIQLELMNMSNGILELYKSIDDFVIDEIGSLDKKLPSDNEFINNMVRPIGTQMFTPTNTKALADKLMQSLNTNRLLASQLENSVNSIIDVLFELCEKDEEIIRYQQQKINMLKANRVEDVIITNTLLKTCMRIYIGADNTGRSATAITQSGILARNNNTLVCDFTGRNKFKTYGLDFVSLEDFMNTRIEKELLCVASNAILSPEKIQDFLSEVRTRLNFYSYVNIILAPEDINGLAQFSTEARTVFYITNCTSSSIDTMRKIVANHTEPNIARELVTIDAPVSPLTIADAIGVDYTTIRIVPLPNINAIRACAIRRDRPFEYEDIRLAFREAFR